MSSLRLFLRKYDGLAMLLVAVALLVKAWVPAGHMIGPASKSFTVTICADGSGEMLSRTIAVPMDSGSRDLSSDEVGLGDACPYSALSMASATAPPYAPLPARVHAIDIAINVSPASEPLLARGNHLRPPLRGPPALR